MNRYLKKILSISLLLSIALTFSSCKTETQVKKEFNINELKELAQLATLECSFNNVATIKQDSTIGPVLNMFMDNSKKAIIEYQGIAKLGIDMGNIKYDENERTMLIPMAEVISVDDDENSYEIITNDEGFWKNRIEDETIKEQVAGSLKEIETRLANNKVLLRKAQGLARVQIEELINSLYTINGKTPEIKYIIE